MKKREYYNILNATGIHIHGGMSVLDNFLKIKFDKYLVDSRSKFENFKNLKGLSFINNSLYSRLKNELYLKKLSEKKKFLKITYLGGLPPLFNNSSFNICCFQNANIFPDFYNNYKLISWFFSKDFIRFIYLYLLKNNVDLWIVFSPISKKILIKNNIKEFKIKQLNIFENKKFKIKKNNKIYDFIYPATYKPHKNHENLLKALIILSKKNIRPKVLLTLNEFEKEKININFYIKKYNLKIFFYFSKSKKNFLKKYNLCKALVYPSLNETIGLPIIEAKNRGLFLLCSNKPYSRQFFLPDLEFDPMSPKNIAEKMIRTMEINFKNVTKLKNFKKLRSISNSKIANIKELKDLFV